jgi:hypothetical protein
MPTGAAHNERWLARMQRSGGISSRARQPHPLWPFVSFLSPLSSLLRHGAHSPHPCVLLGTAPSPLAARSSLLFALSSLLGATQMSQMQVRPHPNAGSPPRQNPRHINQMHQMCQMHPKLHDPRQTPLPARKHCMMNARSTRGYWRSFRQRSLQYRPIPKRDRAAWSRNGT